MRRAILERVIVAVFAAGPLLCASALVACNGERAADTPQPTSTPPTVNHESSGSNPSLVVRTVQPGVGDVVALEGEGWTGVGAVRFYLVTEDQAGTAGQEVQFGRAPGLGEVLPDPGGAVSFEFELAASYERPAGGTLGVDSGDRLYVVGEQDIEDGSSGTRSSCGRTAAKRTLRFPQRGKPFICAQPPQQLDDPGPDRLTLARTLTKGGPEECQRKSLRLFSPTCVPGPSCRREPHLSC
jgi:hypothetical protein